MTKEIIKTSGNIVTAKQGVFSSLRSFSSALSKILSAFFIVTNYFTIYQENNTKISEDYEKLFFLTISIIYIVSYVSLLIKNRHLDL